jgi:hypothetical protein
MVLIQEYEEREVFDQVVESYEELHPGVNFQKSDEMLNKEKLGEVYYTFPGEEARVTFAKKVVEIKKAIEHGYSAPMIILRKKDMDILIDGHRRARAVWDLGISWPALVMAPDKEVKFGIEKLIEGKIKDLW